MAFILHIECPYCGEHTRFTKRYKENEEIKSEDVPHTCNLCGRNFNLSILIDTYMIKPKTARDEWL